VVDAADSIAYDTHDADDAIELGFVSLDELLELPLVATAAASVGQRYGQLGPLALRRAVLHELVEMQVAGLIETTSAQLREQGVDSVTAVRAASTNGARLVAHAEAIATGKRELERFLFQQVYRTDRVMAVRQQAQGQLRQLFSWYCDHPGEMPPRYRQRVDLLGLQRSVADYIAGMTDRFLNRNFHRRLG
jgi:dGTPase